MLTQSQSFIPVEGRSALFLHEHMQSLLISWSHLLKSIFFHQWDSLLLQAIKCKRMLRANGSHSSLYSPHAKNAHVACSSLTVVSEAIM